MAWYFIKSKSRNPLDASNDDYKNFYETLDLDGIKFGKPVTISQIKTFVKNDNRIIIQTYLIYHIMMLRLIIHEFNSI